MIISAELYACITMFTIGVFMQIANFASDINEKLSQLNRILVSAVEGNGFSADDQIILRKKLNEIVEFHTEARE